MAAAEGIGQAERFQQTPATAVWLDPVDGPQ
jgi:hypothetical protein